MRVRSPDDLFAQAGIGLDGIPAVEHGWVGHDAVGSLMKGQSREQMPLLTLPRSGQGVSACGLRAPEERGGAPTADAARPAGFRAPTPVVCKPGR